jgi:secreted trypsin-like serine protease
MDRAGKVRREIVMDDESDCGCGRSQKPREFDAKAAFEQLSRKIEKLGDVVAQYMSRREAQPLRGARGVAVEGAEAVKFAEAVARIVGGTPVAVGDFPECCLVGRRSPNGSIGWFCTGVLVHPRIALTAGHCFSRRNRANIIALRAEDEDKLQSAELLTVRKMVPHPQFGVTGFNDISVMVLRKPATVAPVPIATEAQTKAATETTLVGFGNDDILSTRGFGIKRQVKVPITHIQSGAVDLDDAEQELGFESDLEFVAGGMGFDSCNGDSGGPAYIEVGGKRMVAGLTSRATETARNPCGEGGIYTRVDMNLDFVRSVAASAGINL